MMSVDENKTELNSLIAKMIIQLYHDIENTVVLTHRERVVSNKLMERQNLEPCYKREADDQMFLHAMDLSRQGYNKLCVVSPDSDVVIIALYDYWKLVVDELWVEYGVGKVRKWLTIHAYATELGKPICHALPFWHAFTGCDTVSQFAGYAKKSA